MFSLIQQAHPLFFFPTLQYIWSLPHSLNVSNLKTCHCSQSLLCHLSFSEQHADKLENLQILTWSSEKEVTSCRGIGSVCVPPDFIRSSKSGLHVYNRVLKNEMIWKEQAVTCTNQSSFVSLPWHIYAFRCSTSWQVFVSSHCCWDFLHISVVVNFPWY